MFLDDDETGDLFFCPDCHEYAVVGADHCEACHEGRCGICGELIAKGAPHAAGSSNDVFCEPCDKIAQEESVGEIAERLSDGVPLLVDDLEETTPVEPLTNDEIAKLDPMGFFSKEAA